MATPFSSFDASPLGAFTQSPLLARNGAVRLGEWFYSDSTVGNLRTSADGLTFATAGVGVNSSPVGTVGTRMFGSTNYSDPPYTSVSAYSGLTNQLSQNIIVSGAAMLCVANPSGGNADGRIYRSTNGGSTWASITHPNPSSGGTFTKVLSNLIRLASGTLVAIARSNAASPNNGFPIYSTDDGATWTGGTAITAASGGFGNTAGLVLFQRGNADVVFIHPLSPTSRTIESTDDGATWAQVVTGLPSLLFAGNGATAVGHYVVKQGSTILVFTNKSGTGSLIVIRNDGAANTDYTVTTLFGVGFLAPNGTLYSVKTSDNKLYSSPIASISFSLITTSPSTLVLLSGQNRLIAINALG